jgi:preprotein translocase subunit SecY
MPVIFASSILAFPKSIQSFFGVDTFMYRAIEQLTMGYPLYNLLYIAMIVFFAYFYTAIQFDPVRTADQIRKQGGFIPGIRPGPPTANYLNYVLVRITLPGSLFLAAIALIPSIVLAYWAFNQFPFGGTSVLITVGVALETMKQIESQLMMRHYEGFLK